MEQLPAPMCNALDIVFLAIALYYPWSTNAEYSEIFDSANVQLSVFGG